MITLPNKVTGMAMVKGMAMAMVTDILMKIKITQSQY